MGFVSKTLSGLFSHRKGIRTRLLNFVMLTCFCGSIIVCAIDIFGGFTVVADTLLFSICVLSFLCLWLANAKDKVTLASVIISVVINIVLFPSIFMINGGVEGGMPIWMGLGFVLGWLLLDGKSRYICFALFLIADVSIITLSILYPQYVTPLTHTQIIIDVYVGVVIGGTLISAIIGYGSHLRDGQNRTIQKKDEEIKKLLEEATTAYQAKNDFFANISHDLRTPLAAIVGFSEVAKANPEKTEVVNAYMDKIHAASLHLMGLVDKIIDLEAIDSGRIVIDENEADLLKIFADIKDMVASEANEKNISVNISTKRVFCKNVLADVGKFDQCILAVLDNAIKYTKPNGKVDVTVHQRRSDSDTKINTIVTVTDNGIGMSQAFIDKLFDAFSKEDKSQDSGVGLGLTITKRIVDRMGGSIKVESELGVGTTVVMEFPLRIQTDLRESNTQIENQSFRNRHVLLAEDNHFNAEMIIDILESMGLTVDLAEDGAACVDKYRESPAGFYDIIFMDIQMPYKDGYVATKDIRTMDNMCSKTVPIVAITANAYDEDKLKAVEAGMNFYITKPVDIKELNEVMKVQFRIYDDWRNENGIRYAAQKALPNGQ